MTTGRRAAAIAGCLLQVCEGSPRIGFVCWVLLLLAGCLPTGAHPNQCLSQLRDCVCSHTSGLKRFEMARSYLLPYCYQYSLWSVLDATVIGGIGRSTQQCYFYLDHILFLDDTVARFVNEFEDILRKYDCSQTFSVQSTCHKCKEAYRQWACSMMFPLWKADRRVKPCRNVCHEVERLCPYFLPAEKTGPGSQYAGEPSFLCIDPDVRETAQQSANSFFDDDSQCYRPCSPLDTDFDVDTLIDRGYCVSRPKDSVGVETAAALSGNCAQQSSMSNNGSCVSRPGEAIQDVIADSTSACVPLQPAFLQFGWKWRTVDVCLVVAVILLLTS